jgi:TRAP-type C4-dicarboxylate transport system substrate-binding protein
MLTRRASLGAALSALAVLGAAQGAAAQEVTLRLHQFLPAQANVPTHILDVWADRVEAASDGRIEIQRFPSMQLGGAPPQLIDQAIDGVADIVWTVNGYTPGRFPSSEVFDLPFLVEDARAGSHAYWTLYEEAMTDEMAGFVPLGLWVHGPGIFHTKEPVETPADLEGMQIRGASRMINTMLERLGASAVGMPVPAIAEALSKGVIDGTTIPWEVTPAIRVTELVSNHTEFEGAALYTTPFIFAMNRAAYDALPEDLREVIDAESGLEFSVFAGGTMQDYDAPARQIASEAGNTIITVSDTAAWREAVEPLYDEWVAEMEGRGIDGQALIDRARALMEEYEAQGS